MNQEVPLVEELASALNALLQGHVDQRADAIAAMQRYEVERDRTDLDAATLPIRLVVVIEEGHITAALTDFPHPVQLTVVDYTDAHINWEPGSYTLIPQTAGTPGVSHAPAHAFHLTPSHQPPRVAEICQAVFVADCASPSKH